MSARPVIGKYYPVPCIFVHMAGRQGWMPASGWIPTLGAKHSDADLAVNADHYHIDWRFIDDRGFEMAGTWSTQLGNLITSGSGYYKLDAPTELKRRMCRRAMPDFPAQQQAKWVAFESKHACTKLKPGNICPHRGIDLTPFIKADGTAVCPGHGLAWDTKTGALLPRHGEAGATA